MEHHILVTVEGDDEGAIRNLAEMITDSQVAYTAEDWGLRIVSAEVQ